MVTGHARESTACRLDRQGAGLTGTSFSTQLGGEIGKSRDHYFTWNTILIAEHFKDFHKIVVIAYGTFIKNEIHHTIVIL